jgi:hypothetical protein
MTASRLVICRRFPFSVTVTVRFRVAARRFFGGPPAPVASAAPRAPASVVDH